MNLIRRYLDRLKTCPTRRRLRMEQLEQRELLAVDLVSAAVTGGSGQRASTNGQISRDGRFAVFVSTANNLVSNDVNSGALTDVFRRDLVTGQTVLVSVNLAGTSGGNGNSFSPSMSADGRYIAFVSNASDLQTSDTNAGLPDIFLRDMVANTTTIVTREVTRTGTANGNSGAPSISRDGRFIAFHSQATNLIPAGLDTNGTLQDIFIWDRTNPNTVILMSVPFNMTGSGNGVSRNPIISGNGTFVTYTSAASNLVSIDSNGTIEDVFVQPVTGGPITLVSVAASGTMSGNFASGNPSISDDGAWIAFTSMASNLVASIDTNGAQDVFLRNRLVNTTSLVSLNLNNTASANGSSGNPVISRDGRVVAFTSLANNINANDFNGVQDVFARDRTINLTRLVSATPAGANGNGASGEPDISLDGRFVAFSSSALDLFPNDSNGFQDVFRRDLNSSTTTLLSTNVNGTGGGNGTSFAPRIDDSGQNVVFSSFAFNLINNDTNLNLEDVFLFKPSSLPPSTQSIVTGADRGGGPHVRVFDAGNFSERYNFFAYGASFRGGVRVATGDVNADGVPDIITGAGPGGGPHVRVFNGAAPGQQLPGAIGSFFAYATNFTGGIFVAAADIDLDGRADVITGADTGGGPHVRVFSGATGFVIRDFFALSPAFTGGIRVAAGDVNGDLTPDIITATGPGVAVSVQVFNGNSGSALFPAFQPYGSFGGGAYVSAGDVNLDGRADIVTGAGQGGGPHVRVFNGANLQPLFGFFAYPSNFTGGVRVGTTDSNADGRQDILVASGPGLTTTVRVFSGLNAALISEGFPYPGFFGGAFVAGTKPGAPGGSPLRAEGANSGSPSGEELDQESLAAIAGAALARLTAAGASDQLSGLRIEVADLADDLLGLATLQTILIARDAAGFGWFIDDSPEDDVEFGRVGGLLIAQDRTAAGMDLLTVLAHELGHVLGLEDLDSHLHSDELMAARLAPGVRRTSLAALDAVFDSL